MLCLSAFELYSRWVPLTETPFFLRDSRASERRARLKITPREKGEKRETPRLAFLAMGDFHARSRFARSTIPKEKRGLLVVYFFVYVYTSPREFITNGVTL